MDSGKFIQAINKKIAVDGSAEMLNSIENPSGRKPQEWRIELSKWFLSLGSKDKKFVERIVTTSREAAIFEFLTIIDGVNKTFEDN